MFVFAADSLFGIFDNNLINWLLLVAGLVYLWTKFTPAMFNQRRETIESALTDAAKSASEGRVFLEDQKKRVAQADAEAEQILVEARRVAEEMKTQIAEQTQKDMVDLERKITQQIGTQRQMAITELRAQAATAAVRLAEAALPGAITDTSRSRLRSQFVEQLEAMGSKT